MAKSGRPLKVHENLARLRSLVNEEKKLKLRQIIRKHGIDSFDEDGRTALIWASFFGKENLVKWLIKKGANLNSQDRSGYCSLHFCSQEGNIKIAKILLENKANVNVQDEHGNSPIWTATFNAKGNFDMIKLLRKFDANTTSKNIHGKSPDDLALTIYQKEIDELIE